MMDKRNVKQILNPKTKYLIQAALLEQKTYVMNRIHIIFLSLHSHVLILHTTDYCNLLNLLTMSLIEFWLRLKSAVLLEPSSWSVLRD